MKTHETNKPADKPRGITAEKPELYLDDAA